MKTISRIILLISILSSNEAICCDCGEIHSIDSLRQLSYDISGIVFLGELIDFDTNNYIYTFRIIEQFKGENKTTMIKGKIFDSCSKFPRDKGKWLVYAWVQDSNFINISSCLASRSEIDPILIHYYRPPPPIPPDASEKMKNEFKKYEQEIFNKAKEDWYCELEILRSKNKN